MVAGDHTAEFFGFAGNALDDQDVRIHFVVAYAAFSMIIGIMLRLGLGCITQPAALLVVFHIPGIEPLMFALGPCDGVALGADLIMIRFRAGCTLRVAAMEDLFAIDMMLLGDHPFGLGNFCGHCIGGAGIQTLQNFDHGVKGSKPGIPGLHQIGFHLPEFIGVRAFRTGLKVPGDQIHGGGVIADGGGSGGLEPCDQRGNIFGGVVASRGGCGNGSRGMCSRWICREFSAASQRECHDDRQKKSE